MESSDSINIFGCGLHDSNTTYPGRDGEKTETKSIPRKPKTSIIKLHTTARHANGKSDAILDRKVRETFEPMSLKRKIVFAVSLFIAAFSMVDLMAGLTFADNKPEMFHVIKILLIAVCLMIICTDRKQ